jgi:hypothetical protein
MTARHGYRGLIYISGTELAEANSWSIQIQTDNAEVPKFGDVWKNRLAGMSGWSGNVTAWDDSSEKILFSAATAGTTVALLIYPVRTDLTEYYSGSAIFGMSSAGGVSAAINRDGDFTGNGTLTATGWS